MQERSKAQVREKFSDAEYPIHVLGRNVEITEPMKAYAVEKLVKIERFGGRVVEATITMDIQKLNHTVDFIVNVNNSKIKVSGRSENMYASIDMAIARLENKLRRYMTRLHEHHAKPISEVDLDVNVMGMISPLEDVNDQIEEENLRQIDEEMRPHEIVSREKKTIKMLTQDEAIMKMELSEDPFMIFKSEEDQKLKVIYRRKDENYGIVEIDK